MNNALLIFGGVANLMLAILHMAFWKIFDWPASLATISLENQSALQVLNLHLILIFAAFAYVSLYYRKELIYSKVGRTVAGVIALFYLLRLVNAFIFWGASKIDPIVVVCVSVIIGAAYAVPLFTSMSKRAQTS